MTRLLIQVKRRRDPAMLLEWNCSWSSVPHAGDRFCVPEHFRDEEETITEPEQVGDVKWVCWNPVDIGDQEPTVQVLVEVL